MEEVGEHVTIVIQQKSWVKITCHLEKQILKMANFNPWSPKRLFLKYGAVFILSFNRDGLRWESKSFLKKGVRKMSVPAHETGHGDMDVYIFSVSIGGNTVNRKFNFNWWGRSDEWWGMNYERCLSPPITERFNQYYY